jgi:hypothetical protein
VIVAAFGLRVLVAYGMPNLVWPDEVFQSQEQAHRLVFGYGIIPWEFREGARSWMVPGFLALVMQVTSWFASSPAAYLTTCAAALSAISLAPVWGALRLGVREAGTRGAIVAGGVVAMWFELVYFAPKALSEVVAGNLLALGVVLSALRERTEISSRRMIVIAAVLALAAMLRVQLAPAALLTFVLVVRPVPRTQQWAALITAGAVVLAAGLLDWITWSYPFQSYVENIRINIVEGKSAAYGVAGWTAYFEVYGRIWGPWAVPVLALAVVGARRAPLIALAAALVLIVHLPIAHKEYRFAYPALVLVVLLAGLGTATCVRWIGDRATPRMATLATIGVLVAWASVSLRLANDFHGEQTQLATSAAEQLHWERRRGGLLAMQRLGEEPALCGVAIVGIGLANTGGYTWLHRDVPIYVLPDARAMLEKGALFNGAVLPAATDDAYGAFVRSACWAEACVFTRPGACATVPGYHINRMLERRGL